LTGKNGLRDPPDVAKGPAPFKHTFTKIDARTITGKLYMARQPFYSSTCKKM